MALASCAERPIHRIYGKLGHCQRAIALATRRGFLASSDMAPDCASIDAELYRISNRFVYDFWLRLGDVLRH